MRNRYVLLLDLPLIVIAAFGAFAARFDWQFYQARPEFVPYVLAALVIKPAVFLLLGMYRRYWRYASVQELLLVVVAVTAASGAMALAVLLATILGVVPGDGFSRVVLLNDWILSAVAAGGLRFAVRMLNEPDIRRLGGAEAESGRRILIVGAGDAGTIVAREMRRNPHLGMEPIGFLDDDRAKIGKRISGLPVFGGTHSLPEVVRANRIERVAIAMPKVRGRVVREVVDLCREAGVTSQTIPGVYELLDGQVSVSRLRNIDIADLLRRSPVNGQRNVADYVSGRDVLITGAGGSIGSELARQIAMARPAHLVLVGHGENSIFDTEARLRAAFPQLVLSTQIADIRDARRLGMTFDRFRPAVVFHAAAHKHVPLMEQNPEEAVTNNILGTQNVVREALRTGTERLVMISTDKAVAPTSIMGATKRVAETIVREAGRESGRAFVAVRFGNVLGSRGSVVNTFKAQIEQGGPVMVTHPDMTRFFMTIPEAVHLVLQASGQGKGGELFVLDMGEPVSIVQLAKDMIRLSGLTEEDIPIVFTGIRPGEKLHEVLYESHLRCEPTPHPEVLRVVGEDRDGPTDLDRAVELLADAASRGDRRALVEVLMQTVPGFQCLDPDTSAEGAVSR